MSTVINLIDARLRGIALPSDDGVAQDILDEQEAWLARRIGALTGDRTERLYVGLSTAGKLALARYTAEATVTDSGSTVDAAHYRLVDNGSAIHRTYASPSQWWTGPYVEVTYEPSDELEVQRVLYSLVALAVDPNADATLDSETLGDYSYTTGKGTRSMPSKRAALAASLLPKRDPLISLPVLTRRLGYGDPVINRAEPEPWP